QRRGLARGVGGAAMSAGQLVVIPLSTWLTLTVGWRQSYLWLGLGLVVLILPLGAALLRNDPRDHGIEPYRATPAVRSSGAAPASAIARVTISEAMQAPAFWLLVSSYFICGYTTGGLLRQHFIPPACGHGLR